MKEDITIIELVSLVDFIYDNFEVDVNNKVSFFSGDWPFPMTDLQERTIRNILEGKQ